MQDLNEKRNLTGLILGILGITSLAIVVTIATVYMLNGYETKSIIKSLVINLIIAHVVLLAIVIIGQSFIENVIIAIFATLISTPLWLSNFENIDFIRCMYLSIVLGAWCPVVMKIRFGSGSNSEVTPLADAAVKGDKKEAELLIAKGADVNAKNKYGWTPLSLAESKGHREIAELLRSHGGK